MRNSNVVITDDDDEEEEESTTDVSAFTESDDDSENDVVVGNVPKEVNSGCSFVQGEKVLAFHRCMIYEAKVLEVDTGKQRFFLHYLGWNKKWDEWVRKERVMKHNQENLQKQKALEKEHPTENITKTRRACSLKPKHPNETRGRRRKAMNKGNASSGNLIDVKIPSTLQKHLVDYCEHITHMGKVVKLPCSPNIDDILNLYLEHQSNKDDRTSDSVAGEILSGLRCYFDKALPAMLLYKEERQQYQEATANGVSPSKIYGAEHLLRLFVKLPEILYYANIEEETLIELQHKLHDFLKFMKKKQSLFFLSTYETSDGSCTIE